MRIAIVCPYSLAKPGGVQHQVLCEVRHLLRAGHEVLLAAPDVATARLTVNPLLSLLNLGRTLSIRGNGSMVPLSFPVLDLRKILRRLNQVDVIHMHEPFYPFTSLLLRFTRRPVVATFHAARLIHPFYRYGKFWFAPLYDRLAYRTAVSSLARLTIEKHFSPPPHIIPNGIELPRVTIRRNERRQRYILFVGRNEPRKGLRVLLEAFAAVRQKNPALHLRLIGPGTEHIRADGVQAWGAVDDQTKMEFMQGAQALVAPSLSGESFGIVLLEALALGVLVIASRLAGYEQVITHGKTGLLFEPGDVQTLQAVIERAAKGDTKLQAIANAGLREAKRYSWRQVGPQYEAVLRQARRPV